MDAGRRCGGLSPRGRRPCAAASGSDTRSPQSPHRFISSGERWIAWSRQSRPPWSARCVQESTKTDITRISAAWRQPGCRHRGPEPRWRKSSGIRLHGPSVREQGRQCGGGFCRDHSPCPGAAIPGDRRRPAGPHGRSMEFSSFSRQRPSVRHPALRSRWRAPREATAATAQFDIGASCRVVQARKQAPYSSRNKPPSAPYVRGLVAGWTCRTSYARAWSPSVVGQLGRAAIRGCRPRRMGV